jgi:hypothetical protein
MPVEAEIVRNSLTSFQKNIEKNVKLQAKKTILLYCLLAFYLISFVCLFLAWQFVRRF